jgi:hypothetical protein
MEDKVLRDRHHIEANYNHSDMCEVNGMKFPNMKTGFVEYDTYAEYARPLFENAEKEEQC